MKTDIEIAESITPQNIREIAKKLSIAEEDLFCYGNYIAKVKPKNSAEKGKLVLVTAINPTPQGEGKTTVAIGLADGLSKNRSENGARLERTVTRSRVRRKRRSGRRRIQSGVSHGGDKPAFYGGFARHNGSQ